MAKLITEKESDMKSQGLHDLIKKIFNDPQTRGQFASDPDGVIAKFNITEPEKKAVLSTYARLGFVTRNSNQLAAALDAAIPWLAPIP